MPTMQSKLVSRTIWLEKKKIWKINMDNVPACLDSLLDERLALGRAKRKLLQNQSAV